MLKVYTNNDTEFSQWYHAANNLYQIEYTEVLDHLEFYQPLKIDRHFGDQYLLFEDKQAGICGSAVLTPLSLFKARTLNLEPGSWTLRNVHFHVSSGSSILENQPQFDHLIKDFHKSLLKKLYQLSQSHQKSIALTINSSTEVHEDLKFFGDFQFIHEIIAKEFTEQSLAIGVLNITPSVSSLISKFVQAPLYPMQNLLCRG